MNQKTWKSEIEEKISLSKEENLIFHYEFVKNIGDLFEKSEYSIDQIIILDDVISSEISNHMVFMSLFKDTNTFEIAFPFDNSSPQRFSVNLIKVNTVQTENFIGISIYKEIFNDISEYFEKILLSVITSVINTIKENQIY